MGGPKDESDSESDLDSLYTSSQISFKDVCLDPSAVLINRVLAFTWSLMQRDRSSDIARKLADVFCTEEIVGAKSALWRHCCGDKEILGKKKSRRDTADRTAHQAHAKDLVAAFNKLDADGSGWIDINDIRGVYVANKHPDVLAGKKTEDQILQEFLETFETAHAMKNNDAPNYVVTREEFDEYYNNISASIDDDAYFA